MRMKTLLAAAAAAVVAMAGSAHADTAVDWYVGAQYGWTNLESDGGFDDDVNSGVFEGVISTPVSGNVGAEFE
ncbi:MAG: hypothetical protein AB7O04_15085, partial [Hyphomonadaceae bacterium]